MPQIEATADALYVEVDRSASIPFADVFVGGERKTVTQPATTP